MRHRRIQSGGMTLNLKIEWIRKLKNKAVVEDYKWGSPD